MDSLTFRELKNKNFYRCEDKFHPIEYWSPSEWALAMIGEAGEACNLVKKLNRYRDKIGPEKDLGSDKEIIEAIGAELADTVIYADLLATRLGINLGEAVKDKFNKTSEKVGSPWRL